MDVSLEVSFSTVLARLQSAEEGFKTDILLEISNFLLDRIQKRFLAEKSPDGTPWVPSRAAIREGRRTLYKSGRLFHSIAVEDRHGDAREISTDVPYAIKHQLGIGVIARPFMGVTSEDEKAAVEMVTKKVMEAFGGK